MNSLTKAKDKESIYKESVDNANSFLQQFRAKMELLCKDLLEIEGERCEAVHASVNKFVVYEKFSEMNNKYDVSKIIDEYNNIEEVQAIIQHLNIKLKIPESMYKD